MPVNVRHTAEWVPWCQATGQFGNVPKNETVFFENTGGGGGQLMYVGLHSGDDTGTLDPGDLGVGLGAGHWGSSAELQLTPTKGATSTTFKVTSIKGDPNVSPQTSTTSACTAGTIQLTSTRARRRRSGWAPVTTTAITSSS